MNDGELEVADVDTREQLAGFLEPATLRKDP